MTETDAVGDLYTVWQNDQSAFLLHPENAPLVDRAVKLWATEHRDTWLTVSAHATGAEYCILASSINSTLLTTAAQRRDASVRDKAIEDERRENRRLAGFIESE